MSATDRTINKRVYLDEEGKNLMRPSYFTPAVAAFMEAERAYLRGVLSRYDYDAMVEFGCSDFRLIDTKPEACDYLGVDINPPARKRDEARRGAIIACGAQKILRKRSAVDRLRRRYDGKILCVLPFNFLGTMDDPVDFLSSCCDTGLDLALCLFATGDVATRARLEYYDGCNINVIGVSDTPDSVRLDCDNGFRAFAFSEPFIHAAMKRFGYSRASSESHDVFYFEHYGSDRSPVGRRGISPADRRGSGASAGTGVAGSP